MIEVNVRTITEAEVLAVNDFASESGAFSHFVEADLAACVDLFGPVLQLVERIDTVTGLAGAGAWRTAYPLQFAAQDVVHFRRLRVIVVDTFLPLFQVVLVVSAISVDRAVVQFHDRVADMIEEISVVSHHEQGTA